MIKLKLFTFKDQNVHYNEIEVYLDERYIITAENKYRFLTIRYLMAKSFLNNGRKAHPHTQSRSDVDFSTRKTRVQKGTGFARMGSKSSISRVGGGVAFGPKKNRNFHEKINKKFKKKFLINSIYNKINLDKIALFEGFENCLKTKDALKILNNMLNNLINENITIYICSKDPLKSLINIKSDKLKIKFISIANIFKPLFYNNCILIDKSSWLELASFLS